MKVVLFCGGLGMRMREYSEAVPKPMVPIGYRPVLWHVMKYYAHYGHKDFVLCLGYKANVIKEYFLKYDECVSNDFVYSQGGKKLQLLANDIQDWNITFADTGLQSNIGQRLSAVKKFLADEEMFLANYSDGLSDLPLPEMIRDFERRGKIAAFAGVKPNASFHLVQLNGDGLVKDIRHIAECNQRINGGFFVFRREVFDYIRDGEELVHQPFQRLIAQQQLVSYAHDGFWACMDTVKEVQQLEELYSSGPGPLGDLEGTLAVGGALCVFMLNVSFQKLNTVLCLGAHADDIEIGCGGTILKLVREHPGLNVVWVVFGANGPRRREARASARVFLDGAGQRKILVKHFRDGFFPFQGTAVKEFFESLKKTVQPDLVFTHYREDRHQDHRLLSDLAWNTFRDHLILEYEIPKYDGDLGIPNLFIPLDDDLVQQKVAALCHHFQTQNNKHWFSTDTFLALLRLRGIESASPTRYAEAFHCRKLVLGNAK